MNKEILEMVIKLKPLKCTCGHMLKTGKVVAFDKNYVLLEAIEEAPEKKCFGFVILDFKTMQAIVSFTAFKTLESLSALKSFSPYKDLLNGLEKE